MHLLCNSKVKTKQNNLKKKREFSLLVLGTKQAHCLEKHMLIPNIYNNNAHKQYRQQRSNSRSGVM